MLNERKLKILEAIINDYIMTAEPIGSRTIAKRYNIGISSATIRNEMSDLEEMGLIIQPHASAGRIPSDKGYRLFVDAIMRNRDPTKEQTELIYKVILGNIGRIDYLMRETARTIAHMTSYITIATEPSIARTKIKHIQIIPIDDVSILLVVITNAKAVRDMVLDVVDAPDVDVLNALSSAFNKRLDDISEHGIKEESALEIAQEVPNAANIMPTIVSNLNDIIAAEDSRQFYTSGVKNILALPEFSDMERVRAIIHAMEEHETLITLMESNGEKLQIVIGSENTLENMRELSLIKAGYRFHGKHAGTIAIIGPTRMDYTKVVGILKTIVNNLNEVLNRPI